MADDGRAASRVVAPEKRRAWLDALLGPRQAARGEQASESGRDAQHFGSPDSRREPPDDPRRDPRAAQPNDQSDAEQARLTLNQRSNPPSHAQSASTAPLKDPAVRDLAWLLLSADLLRPQPPAGILADPFESTDEAQATLAWLRALDAAPEPLHRDLAATRITRLGRYAEHLLGWFLQHGPATRLIVAGVQLRRAGVTLGECDFLVETQQGAREHWELAVKCYLHAGDGRASLADYVGPNLKDRFDLKLTHVLGHQLPLSARDEFASTGYAGPWTPGMFIKGWLFYRNNETPAGAPELDPSHGRGWWVTRADWPAFAASHAQCWRQLPRLEWLAPRCQTAERALTEVESTTNATGLVDQETLAAHTADQHGPSMVASFMQDDLGDWIEKSRGFIVPDDWPEQARAYARQQT